MMCFIFTIAVTCLALAGLLLMCGWKSGASKLARIAIALVLGSAIVSWFVDLLSAWFRQPSVQAVAGSILLFVLIAVVLFAVGWFLKHRSEEKAATRPTIRRRAQLMDSEETPKALPTKAAPSTDDIQLFGGRQ